jgi:hypothetical protein
MKKYQLMCICTTFAFAVFGLISFAAAAQIIRVEGNVQVQSPADEVWKKAENGMEVTIGDSIRTARHSKASIALDADKKNTIELGEKTLVVLNSATADTIDRMDVSRGRVYANLEGIKAGLNFEVNTPSAVAGVRGSSYMVYTERDQDEVSAYKDTVFIKTFDANKNESSEIMLPEGFKTFIERFETAGALMPVTNREFIRFDSIRDDLLSRAEGKEPEKQTGGGDQGDGGGQKSDMDQLTEQSSTQEVIDQVTDTKDDIEDTNTQKQIDDLRTTTTSSYYHY